jgi:hypothetical protein
MPTTFIPTCFATSTAARIFGELPEAEIPISRSPGWAKFFNGSLKT